MIPKFQQNGGKMYPTNEAGGIDIATVEPVEKCPKCGGEARCSDWVDNGFGPYAVQNGPFHCECGWIQSAPAEVRA